MSIKDICRQFAALNPGETLLIEISNALNVGEQPSDKAILKLDEAVTAMLSAEDPQMRLFEFQHKLELTNAEGRPPITKDIKKLEKAERMARDYWTYWLLGHKKGEARERVAAKLQLSGEFDKGYPSPETVKNNVERFPKQAEYAFYYWRLLFNPSSDEISRAVDEIKAHLKKYQEKTS